MKKTILVSGASGIVGYGILRSLRKSGKDLRLIGTTIYGDSVAPGFCDVFEQAPPTSDPSYIGWLSRIVSRHQVDLLIPGIEADVYAWAEHVAKIETAGAAKAMLNNLALIALCKDKWIFYEHLSKKNLPCLIKTSLNADFDALANEFGLPFLLKPRIGYGSRGIVKIDSSEIFQKHQSRIGPVLMAQPIIGNDDEEFTTSAFCDGGGGFYACMSLKRKLSKDGFTDRAEVVQLDEIRETLLPLCECLKPMGPTNFQFRKDNGAFKLLEVNPRISSATSIRTAFGYNECQMAVEYYLESIKPQQPFIKRGHAVRYTEDCIFYL